MVRRSDLTRQVNAQLFSTRPKSGYASKSLNVHNRGVIPAALAGVIRIVPGPTQKWK